MSVPGERKRPWQAQAVRRFRLSVDGSEDVRDGNTGVRGELRSAQGGLLFCALQFLGPPALEALLYGGDRRRIIDAGRVGLRSRGPASPRRADLLHRLRGSWRDRA